MIKNFISNKGGLHNRVTKIIRLLPFTLKESKDFLLSRGVLLDDFQLLQIYMAIGGVPHYLKKLEKGESATQAIDKLFFENAGDLIQ